MFFFEKLLVLLALLTCLQAGKTYTNRWDNIDVDEILASDRLLGNYKKCLLDQGPCTAEGQELKKNIPDALQTDCSKCTAKQKTNTEKVIDFMIDNKKTWWEELQKRYDPTGVYYRRRLARKSADHNEGDAKEVEPDIGDITGDKQQSPEENGSKSRADVSKAAPNGRQ